MVRNHSADGIGNAGGIGIRGSHDNAFRHGIQDAGNPHGIFFAAAVGGEGEFIPGGQAEVPGNAAADVRAFIGKGNQLHIRIGKADLVAGDGPDLQAISLIADLDGALGAPVAFQLFRQGKRFLIGDAFRIQVDPVPVVDGTFEEGIQEGIHGILHTHTADEQDHTADDAEERHEAAGFMAQAVAQVPLGAEAERLEAFGFLNPEVFDVFRHIGAQRIGRGALQHFPDGEETDHRQEYIDKGDDDPGERRRMKRPGGQVDICGHGAVRAEDKPAQPVADSDAEQGTEQADNQGVGGIVAEDPAVFEAEGFEGADLRFLAGGNPVHGGDHGQDRDGQEQDRQDGTHGDAFIDLAAHLRPGDGFAPVQDQAGGAERFIRPLHEFRLVQGGFHVDLMIEGTADERPVHGRNSRVHHGRGDIGIAVAGIVRHHLCLVRQADQVFGGFDQAFDRAFHGDGLIGQRQAVTQGDVVGPCVGIGQPEAVRVGIAVRFTVHEQDTGNIHVGADGEGDDVGIILHGRVDAEEARGILHPVHGEDFLQVGFGKSFIRKDAVIRKAGGFIDFRGVYIQGIPLDIETQENSYAQRDHEDHGDELGFVVPQGTEQFSEQHYQSTSSTARGCS